MTDRGSEFTDPMKIEADPETGAIQCQVFYCTPMNSNQKSNCERNHELIRYVIPSLAMSVPHKESILFR